MKYIGCNSTFIIKLSSIEIAIIINDDNIPSTNPFFFDTIPLINPRIRKSIIPIIKLIFLKELFVNEIVSLWINNA